MAAFDTHSFCAQCHDKGKGPAPCVANSDCSFCNILTSDQGAQLSTPRYKLKKEKRDLKEKFNKSATSEATVTVYSCSSLMDPALVSVVGVAHGQGMLKSPGSIVSKEKKKKVTSSDENSKCQVVNWPSRLQTSLSSPPVIVGQPSLLQT